ncbi:eIF5-mimic protein 1 isoform X1 [Dasypus novemcinctus]|uniref:eIF5-mimic protein 1 isoform X1 n=2 Tax=Dasypus novemcinctus TaxID=9361 RepID=UPI0003289236|nr:eIF5-mimic protein 1 isoform X2 [Dasypus novemcinctus]
MAPWVVPSAPLSQHFLRIPESGTTRAGGGLGGRGGARGGAPPGSVCRCQCVCPSLLHCLPPPPPPPPPPEPLQPSASRVVATSSDRNFMNKHQKPVLTGQRFKTRKRDEKEKFEPTVFRDTLVQGLNEAGDDLEAVAKFLDSTGSRLDYRRYADTLFDILVAGSMLAPGGTRIDDGDKTKMTNHCVFSANEDHETIRNYAQVFNKLIRRYKYLEKAFEDEMKKLLLFLKAFSETEQTKLAMLSGILLGNGTLPATILTSLFTDNLVKEGIAASFAVKLFKAWMAEKDANSVTSSLRKANIDKRLLELFPVNRQSVDHFAKYFTDAGLKELSDFLRVQQSLGTRKELQKELQERLSQECPIKEMVLYVKEEMKRNDLPETAVIGLLWTCIMNAVEWNKKEELVAEQALKHLKQYAPLLAVFSSQGQSELILLQKVQEYCYDNIHFMKAFQKIVVLFYKADVLSEEAILKWYKEAHVAKGKSVFLDQMKKFVEWLQNAEEESESEGEEN